MKLTSQQLFSAIVVAFGLTAAVLLAIFADGAWVKEILIFVGGVLVPTPWKKPEPEAPTTLVALLAVGLATGCGGGALKAHASAALVAAHATHAASRAIAVGAEADARESCPDTPDDDADRACFARVRVRWAPADIATSGTVAAIDAWLLAVHAMSIAEREDVLETLLPYALEFLDHWNAIIQAAEPLGVDLPLIPQSVIQLAGGAQ